MELDKVKTKSLRALIYDQLKDKIMAGEIKPGEKLSLRMLAKLLGVSLMPVREAVWQLESDKILIINESKGIKVNSLTGGELQEALRLRVLLESEALTKSCEYGISEELSGKLESLIRGMEEAGDARTFVELNKEFHFILYSNADSPLLFDLIERLWARIAPYMFLNITMNEDLKETPANPYHRELLRAVQAQDTNKALQALTRDIEIPALRIIEESEEKN